MNTAHGHDAHHSRITAATLLIALGIVYGDIGTSPLYTINAIVGSKILTADLVLGAVSCIFWTLTFQTTLKYVLLTLRADNKGEGGIFSLYALVRRGRPWLFFPAIVGGGFLLADGIITPPITISSSVEGLLRFQPDLPTIPIVIAILVGIFVLQQFGTQKVGTFFGPVMLVWFSMLALLGLFSLLKAPQVLVALNPYYAYNLLVNYPEGFWLLGAVFLCTTGAEALYSDLGHCGRRNIQISWIFVKTALLLNYFGQSAYLLQHLNEPIKGQIFYSIVPQDPVVYYAVVVIATAAAIVASQALISGSFTLINEAIRLEFSPRLKIVYPSDAKGQLYIPAVNWFLLAGCIGVVLYFRESSRMEAAYGLAVTLTMIMTTFLLAYYLYRVRVPRWIIVGLLILFLAIELSFLTANLMKFTHGGWVSLLIGALMISTMWMWYRGRQIKNRLVDVVPLHDYLPVLSELSNDKSVPKFSTHLVYLSWSRDPEMIDRRILYSILNRQPKRADIYWLLNIEVVDEPYRMSYRVQHLVHDDVVFIQFRLGFRVEPRINMLFRKVIESMVKNKEVDITSRYESLGRFKIAGDFHFVLLESFLSYENELPLKEQFIMRMYFWIAKLGITDSRNYGLDTSSVTVEKVPLIIAPPKDVMLAREYA